MKEHKFLCKDGRTRTCHYTEELKCRGCDKNEMTYPDDFLTSELGLMRWQMMAAGYPFWHQTNHACEKSCREMFFRGECRPPETDQELSDTNKLSVPNNFYTSRPMHTAEERERISIGMKRHYGRLRKR